MGSIQKKKCSPQWFKAAYLTSEGESDESMVTEGSGHVLFHRRALFVFNPYTGRHHLNTEGSIIHEDSILVV